MIDRIMFIDIALQPHIINSEMRFYLLKPNVLESSVGNIFGHLQSRLSLGSVLPVTNLHLYVDITRYLSTCHCNRPEDGLTQTKEGMTTNVSRDTGEVNIS